MGRHDWYRKTTWSEADREVFFSRLARSRGVFHKAQYLRIQTLHLAGTKDSLLLPEALRLLDLMLNEYPDDSQLTLAHYQRAQCLADLDCTDEALAAYREAFASQRAFPNTRSDCYLGYAEFVLRLGRRELYVEALSVLDEFGTDQLLPVQRYRSMSVRAFINEELGNYQEAKRSALAALSASAETESVFRYHRQLGVVRVVDASVQERLWRLSGSSIGEESPAAT